MKPSQDDSKSTVCHRLSRSPLLGAQLVESGLGRETREPSPRLNFHRQRGHAHRAITRAVFRRLHATGTMGGRIRIPVDDLNPIQRVAVDNPLFVKREKVLSTLFWPSLGTSGTVFPGREPRDSTEQNWSRHRITVRFGLVHRTDEEDKEKHFSARCPGLGTCSARLVVTGKEWRWYWVINRISNELSFDLNITPRSI